MADNQDKQAQIDSLTTSRNNLQSQASELQGQVNVLSGKIAELKAKLAKAKTFDSDVDSSFKQKQSDLETQLNSSASLLNEAVDDNEIGDALKKFNKDTDSKVSTVHDKVKTLIDRLSQEIERLQGQLSSAQKSLDSTNSQLDSTTSQLQDLQNS